MGNYVVRNCARKMSSNRCTVVPFVLVEITFLLIVVVVLYQQQESSLRSMDFHPVIFSQDLVTFATSLGFPPSRYAILQTFPRQSLSSVTQTFEEAGLTHDVALVVEEL